MAGRPSGRYRRRSTMPLYLYRCDACQHTFEQLVHTDGGTVITAVRCPQCGSNRHDRQLTTFNVGNRNSSTTAAAEPFCGRCGENRPPCSN